MKAKLISNPVVSDKLLEGLTLNKEYIVTESFKSNPYDNYFMILDDNNEEQAWNSENFTVTEQDIVAPAIYRHFKHDNFYATVGIAIPIEHEEFMSIYRVTEYTKHFHAEHTERPDSHFNKDLLFLPRDGAWYSDKSKCEDTLVLYVSLYDNHTPYARPLEMFAGLTDKEAYPDAVQDFRFEKVDTRLEGASK